ncbi:MAG: transcription termination/antitermination protein NusA [Legionellales bacterium]|jgi:transcription termination/antitermination protein NusA|nr:transcription termination/antitermination protein NusA [Legionellales bacterium]
MSSELENKKGKEILQIVNLVANEKNIDRNIIIEALESALAAVVAKNFSEEADIRVVIDPITGLYEAGRYWEIVSDEDFEGSEAQISLADAKEESEDALVGGFISEDTPVDSLSRIGASQAKQIIVRLVRDAERQKLLSQFEKRVGELVSAQVKKITKDFITLELYDGAEALMKKSDMVPKEIFHVGDRIRGYLKETNKEGRGPLIIVSRSCEEFLLKVFCLEVPEVDEGQIEIKAAARDAGYRAKIAVKSKDNRVDPIGACVGMRGARVQSISNELNGERIDIILWHDNPAQLVVNALAPAEVLSVVVDEDNRAMDIAVTEDQLSQAIGRNGQNIRLASELTGWSLNVMTQEDMIKKGKTETAAERGSFIAKLDVDDDIASLLLQSGYKTVESVAHASVESLVSIEEFDEEIAEALIKRAKDSLLSDILFEDSVDVPQELSELVRMDDSIGKKLVAAGVDTRDKLADFSVDDLQDIIEISDEDAGALIMEAREIWFQDGSSDNKE